MYNKTYTLTFSPEAMEYCTTFDLIVAAGIPHNVNYMDYTQL